MNRLSPCLKKDTLEFIRCKRMLLCILLLFTVFLVSLLSASLIPFMMEFISKEAPSMISEGFKDDEMLFSGIKGTMGVFSANVILFYVVVVCFVYSRIIPSEIKAGKWIIPLNIGYSEKELLLSKAVIYGAFTSAMPFVSYILYYSAASFFTKNNMLFMHTFANALIIGVVVFACTVCVIMLSYLLMNGIWAAIAVVSVIVAAPDILSMFSFGKYLPTYLLTFLYNSYDLSLGLAVPLIFTAAIPLLLVLLCIRKTHN